MIADMLVKLYDLEEDTNRLKKLKNEGIRIERALALDKKRVVDYLEENFETNWACECERAFANHPISCFIAIQGKKVIGVTNSYK